MRIYEVLDNPDEDDTFAVTVFLQDAGLADGGLLTTEGEILASHIKNVSSYALEEDDSLASLIGVIVRTVWGEDAFRALAALPSSPRYDSEE